MKSSDDGSEAEWLTLEMKIGNWSANQTEPKIWGQVNKIAQCDLEAQLCTVTDNYFAAMSFDFKQKLNSAFGTIGETAYFVQGTLHHFLFFVIFFTLPTFSQGATCSKCSTRISVSPISTRR